MTATEWNVIKSSTDERLHVVPDEDIKPHVHTMQCWCRPYLDEAVCVHFSAKERERRH